jgi:hypothetical protein
MKEKRWFDDEDFTPEHDRLMIDLMTNYKEILERAFLKESSIEDRWEIFGEPSLDGYPPIYPDAIIQLIRTIEDPNDCGLVFSPHYQFIIEIKPKIDSFGSVLRQIQMYRDRIKNLPYLTKFSRSMFPGRSVMVLFTPDTRFDSLFQQQKIEVIHPKEVVQ